MSLGKNIAALRKDKGFTQVELGDLLGVSNQAVSKWEAEMTMPDVMLLPKIAEVLGVGLDDLYAIKKETPDLSIPLPKSEINMQDNRILNIIAKVEGVDVKIRMPGKVLQAVMDLCFDENDDQKKTVTALLNNIMPGTEIDLNNENCDAKLLVEENEI